MMREIRYICIYDESVLTIERTDGEVMIQMVDPEAPECVSVSISDNTAKLLIKDLQELLK